MIDKPQIREKILNFFSTRKLCTTAYNKGYYKDSPEIYEFVFNYYKDEPTLQNASLAQILWHIKHNIDVALPNKFINYTRGYAGLSKKKRRFSCFDDFIAEFNVKVQSLNSNIQHPIYSISECNEIIFNALCVKCRQYKDIIDNDNVVASILYHTPHILDNYYKLLYIVYGDDIYCPYCKKYKSFTKIYSAFCKKTCDDEQCKHRYLSDVAKLKNIDHLQTDDVCKKRVLSRAGYKHSDETKEKIRNTNKQVWTKDKRNALVEKNYNTGVYEKQSQTMKQLILDGKFTPKSTNRFTHKVLYSEKTNIAYRSSWELQFHESNLQLPLEYETLRIPYMYDNIKHIYVVDFVDHINKQVYEIKPQAYCVIEPNITKIHAGKNWCNENGYTFNLITESELCL